MPIYRFDDVTVDAGAHEVRKAGREVQLEPKSFRVLVYLIENRGRAVSKEELIQALWGESFVTDNALTRVIAQIRKALGDDARLARYIETVPTVGYRFVAQVTSGDATVPARSTAKPRWWFAVAGGVASIVAAFWLFFAPEGEARSRDLKAVHVTTSSGLDVHPAFSPDGSSIAYANDRTGRLEIYVRPLAIDGREMQLTGDGGQNVQPAWSPDGRYIAYHSTARGGIHLVPALGGAARQITSFGSQPVWSPDGTSIAFRGERQYSQALPDLAPSGPSVIWLVPATGGEPRPLTNNRNPEGAHTSPAWSPDGRRLLFLNPRSLQIANLWVVDVTRGASEPIDTGKRLLVSAVFAPDGSGIYMAGSSPDGESGVWFQPLHRGTLKPAGAAQPITASGGGFVRDLTISADGKRLGYVLAYQSSNLHSMPIDPRTNLAAGPPRPLTRDTSYRNSLPVYSPDGARLAYFVRRKGILGDIWVMDRDGGNVAPVTTNPAIDFLPNWSADGRSIVYGSNRDGVYKLWVTTLDDRRDSIFAAGPQLVKNRARVSPDGRYAAYFRHEGGNLAVYRLELRTGQETRVSAPGESVGYPCWSPDSRWIAAERRLGDDTVLVILPAEGGAAEVLTDPPGHAWVHSWSPDGRKLALAQFRNGSWSVEWIDRRTRERRELIRFDSLAAFVRYPAWSPRNNEIAYELTETRGNIFVADLR